MRKVRFYVTEEFKELLCKIMPVGYDMSFSSPVSEDDCHIICSIRGVGLPANTETPEGCPSPTVGCFIIANGKVCIRYMGVDTPLEPCDRDVEIFLDAGSYHVPFTVGRKYEFVGIKDNRVARFRELP